MGDVKVEINNVGLKIIMGRHGIGKEMKTGRTCLICLMNNIVMSGNIFQHKDKHRVEWISPNKRTENQTGHILVTRQHRTSIRSSNIYTTKKRLDILQRREVMRAFSIEL